MKMKWTQYSRKCVLLCLCILDIKARHMRYMTVGHCIRSEFTNKRCQRQGLINTMCSLLYFSVSFCCSPLSHSGVNSVNEKLQTMFCLAPCCATLVCLKTYSKRQPNVITQEIDLTGVSENVKDDTLQQVFVQ